MKRLQSKTVLFFLSIAILILALRIPSLEERFDNDSSAVAYSARLITRGEPLYSTHHPGHHMPLVYYTYALAFELLGDATISVKILLIPWMIATAISVYALGKAIQDERTGMFAAVIFSVLSSHVFLKGTTAEPEMFAMLPYSLAFLLAVSGIQRGAGGRAFVWVGVAGAFAFFYKIVFLAPLGAAALMIMLDAWRQRAGMGALRLFWQRCLGISAGFAVVVGLVFGYFAWQGLLDRFWLVFTLGRAYVNMTEHFPAYLVLIIPIFVLTRNNVLLTIFSLAGALRLWRTGWIKERLSSVLGIPMIGLMILFLLSMLTAGITRVGYPHYSLIIIPSLSVISGWELVQLSTILPGGDNIRKRKAGELGFVALVLLVLINSGIVNFDYYSYYIQYKLGIVPYQVFTVKGTQEGKNSLRTQALVQYIKQRTNPDDLVYHWTDFPQIYYYAERNAPIDMIWPNQAELTGSYERIFSPQTQYILVGKSMYLPEPAWMQEELDEAYQLEKVIDEQRIYRRVAK